MSEESDTYRWNISIRLAGVRFEGPGLETENDARTMKQLVENSADTDVHVEVFQQ